MRVILALSTCGFLLISCTQLTKKEETRITFEPRTVLRESVGCKKDSSACASYIVTYPDFSQLDTAVQRMVSTQLFRAISGAPEGSPQKTLEQSGDDFIADYEKTKTELPDYGMAWYYKADARVLILSDTLISIQADADAFTGGAHGMFSSSFVNIDPKTGALYLLDSFLKPGYQNFLNQLGEEEFRKENDLADTTSLDEAGFDFEENRFQLNENYGFRKEGIVFIFNSYEVAAYAAGPTEIIIPYEKLKGWFK